MADPEPGVRSTRCRGGTARGLSGSEHGADLGEVANERGRQMVRPRRVERSLVLGLRGLEVQADPITRPAKVKTDLDAEKVLDPEWA